MMNKWKLKIDKSAPGEEYEDGMPRPSWLWVWKGGESVVAYKPMHREEDLADFRLIAAAPELLDALKELAEFIDAGDLRSNRMTDIMAKARAAIAKAEAK